MAAPRSELENRILYGVLAAIAAALVITAGGFVFYVFMVVMALLASLEFDKMRGDGKICFLYCALPILFARHPQVALIILLVVVGLLCLAQYTEKKQERWLISSVFYVSVPVISLIWMRALPNGLEIVFWLVLLVVATDVGAFIFGKKFGKHPLAPSISPKKTWEGLAGGVLFAAVTSWIYGGSLGAGIVIALLAQGSDLMESGIKRNFGVKDSGTLLPGHGGVMDRTDGLVLTAPFVAAACYYGVIAW